MPQALLATTVTVPDINPAGNLIVTSDLFVVRGLTPTRTGGIAVGAVIRQPGGAVNVHVNAS